ncbi:MAG TPA: PQQ-binding-like beta-propeller repeat protein, partial [Pirellulales bacterium]|nr:PQQ-binding-like beta-propeller repeat protein [Pirellulales bacterium]
MALERGDGAQARNYWQQLISADRWQQAFAARPDRRPPWLVYPDTDIDPAEIAARLLLATILDNAPTARPELDQFRAKYPESHGRLAGHDADYAQTLGALLEASGSWTATPELSDWATFAGADQRTRQVRARLDVGAVRWKQVLPKSPGVELSFSTRRVAEDHREPLSYYPLVVGDWLLVNSQFSIRAYDIRTGNPAWGLDPVIYRDPEFTDQRHTNRPTLGMPRFTMTASGGKLFARMGSAVTGTQNEQPVPSAQGYIACLDLAAEGKLLWRATPSEERWAFEGSPLCDGQRVYVGMRRSDVRPQAHVACLDVRTGQLLWRRLVCSAETPAQQGPWDEITHNLLTLHEGLLYYNTNLGAVAALDAGSGHLAWVTSYPRAKSGDLSQRATHFYRDLTPCVYDSGRLFVAPSDAPPVFALDAASGLLLWKVEPSQNDTPIHLIGVAGGHLWASGEKLWWIDIATGKRRGYWPEGPTPKSLGRGALAGDKVYWPTTHEIYVFDQQSGLQVKQPIELSVRGAP